jgi:NhaP-type Na+/H+ and K+/H+ antiporter
MSDAINIILLLASTIMVGYASLVIFRRTNIPDVVILLLFGLFLNYSGFVNTELFRSVAPILAPLTLLIVLLDSGLGMEMRHVLGSFPRSILLGVLGLALSMIAAAFIGTMVMGLDLKMSLLMGSIFGGTCSVTVITILKGVNMGEEVKSLLSLESVFNDSLIILSTVAILGIIVPFTSAGSPILSIVFSYVVGIV